MDQSNFKDVVTLEKCSSIKKKKTNLNQTAEAENTQPVQLM